MSLIPPTPPGSNFSSYSWQDWYEKIRRAINNSTSIAWSQITDFTGSNLTALLTRDHKDLQNLQGGTTAEYYHMTAAEHTALAAGFSGTVVLAKITVGGTNGSLTVSHGHITAYVAPT